MQFGIFASVEAQDINLRGNLQGSKCDGDCIFLWELFLFYEKFLPLPLTLWVFFRKIFTPTPGEVFNWSSYAALLKKPANSLYKKTPKMFLKLPKEQNASSKTPLSNSVFQISTQSKSSDRAFFTKIEDHNYMLWIVFFTITWRTTSMDKPILANVAGCYQNKNPLHAFLWVYIHLQKFHRIVPGGGTF